MKNLIATLIFGVLMSGNITYANGTTTLPTEKPAKSASVTFDNLEIGSKLYIKNQLGKTLFSEKIKSEGEFTTDLNRMNLPENNYYFEIDKKREITQIPFEIESGEVTLHSELEKNIYKPVLDVEENKVTISRAAAGTQFINIEIFYEGRDLVYAEETELKGSFKRAYDFSTSSTGMYLIEITYDNRSHYEYVNIVTMY